MGSASARQRVRTWGLIGESLREEFGGSRGCTCAARPCARACHRCQFQRCVEHPITALGSAAAQCSMSAWSEEREMKGCAYLAEYTTLVTINIVTARHVDLDVFSTGSACMCAWTVRNASTMWGSCLLVRGNASISNHSKKQLHRIELSDTDCWTCSACAAMAEATLTDKGDSSVSENVGATSSSV